MKFVDKVNSGKGALWTLLSLEAYCPIQSFTACFKLRHQIEIRVIRLISKVLMVFKTVNYLFTLNRLKLWNLHFLLAQMFQKMNWTLL